MEPTLTFQLPSESDTKRLAAALAQITQKGDVWALFGTLGMGKSTMARAFIQHLTGAQEVPSPTFTLVQSYEAPLFEIYHFDLYRIKSAEEIFELGIEDALYDGVTLIEWPERMNNYLPRDIFRIEIYPEQNGRKAVIMARSDAKFARLLEAERIFYGR